jgi:hypothetical protein
MSISKWPKRGILASALVALTLSLAAAPASAASAPSGGAAASPLTLASAQERAQAQAQTIPSGAVKVDLRLNCNAQSPSAHKYAVAHNICPAPAADGSAAPQNTMWGACGSSWLFVTNPVPHGAKVEWGVMSVLGTIVYVNFAVSWGFTPQGAGLPVGGILPDVGWVFTSYYDNWATGTFPTGTLAAQFYGDVTLIWGGTCYVIPPGPADFKPIL